MKKYWLCLIWFSWHLTCVEAQDLPFTAGEKLEYVVKMGPFTIADAQLEVLKEDCSTISAHCLHIQLKGRTVNPWRLAYPVNDVWGSYYDPLLARPHLFYRYLREGGYRKYETTIFNKDEQKVSVQTYHDPQLTQKKNAATYEFKQWPQDMLSSYYLLRGQSFEYLQIGDSIQVHVFFEDAFYLLDIRYLGMEKIKAKVGKLWTYVLSPILPENKLFNKKESIKVWISKDANHILVKAKADFYLGHVSVELTKTKNLKYKLETTK